jgi:hypothetical protein
MPERALRNRASLPVFALVRCAKTALLPRERSLSAPSCSDVLGVIKLEYGLVSVYVLNTADTLSLGHPLAYASNLAILKQHDVISFPMPASH